MAKIIDTSTVTMDSLAAMSWNHREGIYNGLDCTVTLEVFHEIHSQLDNVSTHTYEFSKSLQAPILEMMMRGVKIDQRRRAEVLKETTELIHRVAYQLDRIVKEGIGVDVNWRSPQQLMSLLYDVMGLPVQKKRNANGHMSATVNREAIERLTQYYIAEPLCQHLIALRELDKKRQFLEAGIDSDGRIRTNFNIAGTNTGRLASAISDFETGGNLQNVDRSIREIFIADDGMKFCNIDLEQGDARNVGAICWNSFAETHGEDFAGSYLNACMSSDLHTSVCRMAWTGLEWCDDDRRNRVVADTIAYRQDSYRQLAKKLGHGTNYYGTPGTMAKHAKVDKSIIEDFQQRYFTAFPCLGSYNKIDRTTDHWHNRVRNQLRHFSHLTTLLGRRRYFFGRWNDDETLRAAIAYEPQSLTADEIDTGLLRLWRAHKVQLLIQVHDSILFQYPEEQEDEILPWALKEMRVNIPLAKGRDFYVPCEAKCGFNWGEFSEANPDGLVKWKPNQKDQRKRSRSQRGGS